MFVEGDVFIVSDIENAFGIIVEKNVVFAVQTVGGHLENVLVKTLYLNVQINIRNIRSFAFSPSQQTQQTYNNDFRFWILDFRF
jgi:hypothetical protein